MTKVFYDLTPDEETDQLEVIQEQLEEILILLYGAYTNGRFNGTHSDKLQSERLR